MKIVASQPPERRLTATPTARANLMPFKLCRRTNFFIFAIVSVDEIFSPCGILVQTYLTPKKSNPVYWLHFFDRGKCQNALLRSRLLKYLTFWKSDKMFQMLGVTHVKCEVFNLSLIWRMSNTNLRRRFWGVLIFSPGTKFLPFLTSFLWSSWAAFLTKSSLEL